MMFSTKEQTQLKWFIAHKYWGNRTVLGTSHSYYNVSPNDIGTRFNIKIVSWKEWTCQKEKTQIVP